MWKGSDNTNLFITITIIENIGKWGLDYSLNLLTSFSKLVFLKYKRFRKEIPSFERKKNTRTIDLDT